MDLAQFGHFGMQHMVTSAVLPSIQMASFLSCIAVLTDGAKSTMTCILPELASSNILIFICMSKFQHIQRIQHFPEL
jgi:hypothetical protein